MLNLWFLLFFSVAATDAVAVGMTFAMYITGATLATAGFATMAIAFAINLVVSSVISKVLYTAPSMGADIGGAGSSPNPGNRQQIPPATDNKVPVIYGDAWVGGTIVDLSISSNNQELYYVMSLCEVTNTNTGQTPDVLSFGDVYYGGKKVIFDPVDQYKVTGLLDESTGVTDTAVAGKIEIYLYRNGSSQPTNSALSAIAVMSNADLIYKWGASKLMTNCAFAIVHLTYNADAGIRGIEQTRYQVLSPRFAPGDCISDYLLSTRYGAALPSAQINSASLEALNEYSNESFTYTTYDGDTSTQTRFRFDGTLETTRTVMQNLQDMASCCDCIIKYNEITAQWGVIVQRPEYTVAMEIDDSNIVSAIGISPTDLANTFNIAEVKFPDKSNQDAFNSSTFDLAQIDPELMFPNEPVNKQSISLPFINDSVRAQYLANRFLKSAREDLIVDCSVNFVGIQLEAGDVLTLTNANYGWVDKLFRINRVSETFGDDGSIVCKLLLVEFNPTVYDDAAITQFTPSPNSGIGSPTTFGSIPTPEISNEQATAVIPSFDVNITTSEAGITQYAEVWYSAFQNPTDAQRIFAGTTAIKSSGQPYEPSEVIPAVTLSGIPFGNWYFFSRMVNSLSSSTFSAASSILNWRPTTFQYVSRWIAVAYADSITGDTGFSYSPRNKSHFGLLNNTSANGGTDPSLYTWYAASANFSTNNYLLYANRSNRKFSFAVDAAGYINLGGAFVPSNTSVYDSTVWSAAIDPTGDLQTFIDLDARTGQSIISGSTGNNQNDGFMSVTNTTSGSMKVNLHSFLNFGAGIYTKNFDAASLTIDIYGRVVGFLESDEFFYTETVFIATGSQTVFPFAHTVGWLLAFRNGSLLDPTDYSETSANVTMATACAAGENVVLIAMRGVSTSIYYEPLNITIASATSNTITYASAPWNSIIAGDQLAFTNTGSPTLYTVSTINTTTKEITFTGTIAGATTDNVVYRYRDAGSNYSPFTRYDQDVSAITTFSPTAYALNNGFEMVFINGCQINEIDYNLTLNVLDGFPSPMTGKLSIVMFTQNNLSIPASNVANTTAYSTAGQTTYPFASNPLAMEVYANGALLTKGSGYDYTASAANFILVTEYPDNVTLFNQQTFARIGAA